MPQLISVILPVYNEDRGSLEQLLDQLTKVCSSYSQPTEIIVVDDGSTTTVTAPQGIRVLRHPYNMGNGAAIKTGARKAKGNILVFMDADSQHNPDDIPHLLSKIEAGHDMAVGARSGSSQANKSRWWANTLYNWLASLMVGHRVHDLTSGFRAVVTRRFREFLYLLPNGFSYPTTITMAFFRAGYSVAYIPIVTETREGKSHINPLTDGLRFLLIIFRVGTLYSPLKLFFPVSLFCFLIGAGYYIYTYINYERFTNMSALLFITSMLIFLIGLVSEQITNLLYSRRSEDEING